MNPFDQSLDSIFKVYGDWNPLSYMEGMDQLELSKMYNQGQLKRQTIDNTQLEQAFPEKQRQMRLGNDTTEAQLPGVRADSSLRSDKAALSRTTLDKQLETALRQMEGQLRDEDYKDLEVAGNTYAQAGAMLGAIPGPARQAAAKQLLGKYYRPEFDSYNPGDLEDTISTIGKWMMQARPKNVLESDKADAKLAMQRALEDQKQRGREELQSKRLATQERLAQAAQAAVSAKDPKKLEELATRYMILAEEADSPQEAEALKAKAAQLLEAVRYIRPADTTKPQTVPIPGVMEAPDVRQNPLVTPSKDPNAATQRPKSLADLQKMYPEVPPEKLKEAYKKKFGIDLQ